MPISRWVGVVLGLGLLGSFGCADSSPTGPTVQPRGSAQELAAAFTLTVDNLGSQEAVTGVSEITVDARSSAEAQATRRNAGYRVEFGDGATATEALARHVYSSAGTYEVKVALTDDTGRISTTSRKLVVATPLGAWFYSGYVAGARRVEVRMLTLTAQDGLTVRGTLGRAGAGDVAVTGVLTHDRRIRLVAEGGSETLEGVLPSVISGDRATLGLAVHGGPADGEMLSFTPRIGQPTGPPPDAVLRMRFFSFSAPFAIKQISPIQFDGSASRGEGLTYYIEFGDRQFATDALVVHPIDEVGKYEARLTVVDRFGRSDVETMPFEVRMLVTKGYYVEWDSDYQGQYLTIDSQEGTAVTGTLNRYSEILRETERPKFAGTVEGNGNVRFVLAGKGESLVGTLALGPYPITKMLLTYVGGPHNGQTLNFYFRDGY